MMTHQHEALIDSRPAGTVPTRAEAQMDAATDKHVKPSSEPNPLWEAWMRIDTFTPDDDLPF